MAFYSSTLAAFIVLTTSFFATSFAAPPCTDGRSIAVCLQFLNPYSDNYYFWTSVLDGAAPSNTSVLTGDNGEDWDPIDGCPEPSIFEATCCAFDSVGIYLDCDGPATELPPLERSAFLPQGWTATLPCAVDVPSRVLANVVTFTDPAYATPYACTSHCSALGYRYAGLEYGTECHCGTGYAGGVAPVTADVSECDMRCTGDFIWPCGGSWRIQIYTDST